MENPWSDFLSSAYMIHALDQKVVQSFNSKVDQKYAFLSHLAPEPWIGSFDSNLVVLYANPGATDANVAKIFQPKHEMVIEKTIKNLHQTNADYPHFHFDSELEGTEGWNWYQRSYKELIKEFGNQQVARNLMTCEIVPYHSKNWKAPKEKMPTQEFTNYLVKQAMERDAMILLHRSEKIWLSYVPDLEKYPRLARPNSFQSAAISKGNYPKNWNQILEAVSR